MLSQQRLVLPHRPCLLLKSRLQETLSTRTAMEREMRPPANLGTERGNLFENRNSEDERPPTAQSIPANPLPQSWELRATSCLLLFLLE